MSDFPVLPQLHIQIDYLQRRWLHRRSYSVQCWHHFVVLQRGAAAREKQKCDAETFQLPLKRSILPLTRLLRLGQCCACWILQQLQLGIQDLSLNYELLVPFHRLQGFKTHLARWSLRVKMPRMCAGSLGRKGKERFVAGEHVLELVNGSDVSCCCSSVWFFVVDVGVEVFLYLLADCCLVWYNHATTLEWRAHTHTHVITAITRKPAKHQQRRQQRHR